MEAVEVEKTKRKRKKKALEARMQYVPSKDGLGSPYVAFFPSGFNPSLHSRTGDDDEGNEVAAYRNPKPMSRQQELVIRTPQNVDFVGSNYVGESAGWQPFDYLLGVLDKANGSLKLVPLAGEKVFRMEPRVRGCEYGRVIDEEAAAEEEGDAAELGRIKKRLLTETFGSQQSRRRAARYERGQVKEGDLGEFTPIEGLFKAAAQNKELLTTEQASEQANRVLVRNIPPHDVTATIPETAYLLEKMISSDEWEALDVEELKSAALNTSAEPSLHQNNLYPTYLLNRLKRLRIEGDKEGNDRRAHILLYMKHLLAFFSAPHGLVRKAADPWATSAASNTVNLTELLRIPGAIVAKFLEVFTTKGVGSARESKGCLRTKEHLELIISYILVLGLMVDEFQSDPFDLAKELKMTVLQLRPHYMELGCKYNERNMTERKIAGEGPNSTKLKWKVTLPVPLRFPKIANSYRPKSKQ